MMRIRTHPGAVLRRHYIETQSTTITKLAESCGVSTSSISRVIHEKSSVSPELAYRLEVALGKSAQFWLNLQNAHDLSVIQNNAAEIRNTPHHLELEAVAV